jgi:hypothetical protein
MKKWLSLAFCVMAVATAGEPPRVEAARKEFEARVAALRADFARRPETPSDKEWIQAKLQHMVDVDQYMRTFDRTLPLQEFSPDERKAFGMFSYEKARDIDGRNLVDLKKLLQTHRWFTVSEFGSQADHNAWLLVQHADEDRDFQKQILALLEPLAAKGETSPKNFAYLYDRVAVNLRDPANRSLQRYGTQGRCTGPGTWEPFPVESPDKLDERRQAVGLMPEAEYQILFKDICRESDEETMRKAIEAAKAGG